MAKANSTGAPAPDQPSNPFICAGNADGTRQAISEIIALLNDRWMTELELCGVEDRIETSAAVVSAEMRILDGIAISSRVPRRASPLRQRDQTSEGRWLTSLRSQFLQTPA